MLKELSHESDSQRYCATLKDQCLAQSSPEKRPLAIDRNKFRDQPLGSAQRVRDLGMLNPKWEFSIQSLSLLRAQRTLQERKQK